MSGPSEVLALSRKFKIVTAGLGCQVLQKSKQYFVVLETRVIFKGKTLSRVKQKVKVLQGPCP